MQHSEESFRASTRAVLAEGADTGALRRLGLAMDDALTGAVAHAFPQLDAERLAYLTFHLSDWREEAAFLVAFALAPDRFTPEEASDGLVAFLLHAPNHVAAAAKLAGFPVSDIFAVGALDGADPDSGPAI